MKKVFTSVLILVCLFLIPGCGYNRMQQAEETVFKAWADIESTLQRRADLIPNLVETVKGFAAHEKETLQGVVEARSKATALSVTPGDLSDPQAMQRLADAQGGLSSALARLMVVVERYPDLKANQNFLQLQNQLSDMEEHIQMARRYYNGSVRNYNIQVESFPDMIIASSFKFRKKDYFELVNPVDREVPKVDFSN